MTWLIPCWAIWDTLVGVILPVILCIVLTWVLAPRFLDQENADTATAMAIIVGMFFLGVRVLAILAHFMF